MNYNLQVKTVIKFADGILYVRKRKQEVFLVRLKLIGERQAIVAVIDGEIDHHSAEKIRTAVDTEINRTNAVNVIFDFRGVTFMDSSGIGVILGRYRLVQPFGGEVVIFGACESVRRVLDMSGRGKIVKITTNLDNALMLI